MKKEAIRITLLASSVGCFAASAFYSGAGNAYHSFLLRTLGISLFSAGIAAKFVQRPAHWLSTACVGLGVCMAIFAAYALGKQNSGGVPALPPMFYALVAVLCLGAGTAGFLKREKVHRT